MALVVSTTSKVSSGFDPRTIPGCQVWLDAADTTTLTLSGSNVTQWNDKSGNGNHATSIVSALTVSTPTYNGGTLNGRTTVSFGGSSDVLKINNNFAMSLFPSLCYFIVIRPASSQPNATYAGILSTDTPDQYGRTLAFGSGNWQEEYYNGFTNITSYTANVWTVTSLQFSSTTSTTLAVNGTTYAGTATGTKDNTNGLHIGAYNNGAGGGYNVNNANFDTAEILVYGADLTTTQRQQIEGYLARKWGLSSNLPATHLYRSIPIVTRAFQPIDIANCAVWLDGADATTLTLSGSNVTQWNDKSGNGRNATKSAAGTLTFSNNRIVFNGTSYLSLPSGTFPTGNSNYSFLTVGSTDRSSYQNIFFTGNYSAGQSIDAIYYPDGSLESGWYSSNIIAPAGTIPANQTILVENVYSSPTLTAYVNGTSVASSSSLGTRNNPSGVTVLGGNLEGNQALKGTMCEFLVYSAGLTTTERQQIEGYLAAKWGLRTNLPSTHPFKLVPAITPVFTPLQISGCRMWLDAADATTLTLSGSNVTQWNDKSGNGRNATQGTSARQPTYLSGTAVAFNKANSNVLTLPDDTIPSGNSAYSVFVAITPTTDGADGAGNVFLYSGNLTTNQTNGFFFFSYLGSNQFQNYWYAVDSTGGAWTKGTRTLIEFVYTQNVNRYIYQNGALQVTTPSSNRASGTGNNLIGAQASNAYYSTCDIHEIIIYNVDVTAAQRQQVEGYLTSKWGLKSNLPTTHPFKVITP